MNLKQATHYFDMMRRGKMKRASVHQIASSLTEALWFWIYTSILAQVYDIKDATEMRSMLKSEVFPPLSKYNQKYFKWKMKQGPPISYPHHLTGRMKANTHIDIFVDRVLFYIPSLATHRINITKGGKVHTYNFGPIHERRKSVLKATVVFAWKDIRKRIRNVYKRYAEMA